jgi:hypothetical protein
LESTLYENGLRENAKATEDALAGAWSRVNENIAAVAEQMDDSIREIAGIADGRGNGAAADLSRMASELRSASAGFKV